MSGWLERFGYSLGRRAGGVLRSIGLAAAVVPSLATAAQWDPSQASSNLGIFALSDAQLEERKITVTPIGELELPTGEIIACDPLISDTEMPALSRRVKPGRYPVSLLEAQGRVAISVLRFKPGTPVRWELATVPGQD